MTKRVLAFLLVLLFASTIIGQDGRYILRPGGELIKLDASTEVQTAIQKAQLTDGMGNAIKSNFLPMNVSSRGTIDTLSYATGAAYSSRFGFTGQDVLLTWYKAPADLIIKAAGIKAALDDILYSSVSIRLIKLNYTEEQLNTGGALRLGYFPSSGTGGLDVAAFPEDKTGDWVSVGGDSPFGESFDLWSDAGFGWPVEPQGFATDDPLYQWVDMMNLGFEPTVDAGEIFAIAVIHDSPTISVVGGPTVTDERVGFWSWDASTTGNYSWKYYEGGRSTAENFGWWIREYTFDFPVVVDLVGDRAPVVSNVTKLGTTVITDAREVSALVTDDNPGGGPAGVASVDIVFTVNSGAEQTAAMTASGDVYTGQIPGMVPGDTISYYIRATDVGNNVTTANGSVYQIYRPSDNVDVLVIVNGASTESRLKQLVPYYFDFIGVMAQPYDLWYYGSVGVDLLNNYSTVIELQMSEGAPSGDNREAYLAWTATGNKNLLIAGQEELGFLHGYANLTFVAGEFEYEVLGVLNSYNDVSYAASGDEALGSVFKAQAGTALGDSLAGLMLALPAPDTLLYDPVGILGDANATNWFDQFDPRTDIGSEVFMHGVSIAGVEAPTGHNWTMANGTKVVFMAFDPLVLAQAGAEGEWVGTYTESPFHQAMRWFGLDVVSVREINNGLPKDFNLAQNYPNPFNPSTTIQFTLTETSKVTLKVFDVLGREVATLLDKEQPAGSYEFDFNASDLSSGMYIYTIKAGTYSASKKMMLMK